MNHNNEIIQKPRQTITELLSEATIEIFSENGLNFSNMRETQEILGEEEFLIALIGLSNDSIRLSLTLLVSQSLLNSSLPEDIDEINDIVLQDWIGELSNSLAGRIKHKLVSYGCILNLGLPTVIQGNKLQIEHPKKTEFSAHQFSTETNELIEVGLNTLQNEDFVLHTPMEADESKVVDEVMFF